MEIRVDVSQIAGIGDRLKRAGNRVPDALRLAINHTGDKMSSERSPYIRHLSAQMGTSTRGLKKYFTVKHANYGSLTYRIIGKGAAISLKEFKPRQTGAGVSAAPWNTRRVFPHTFLNAKMGGHVFKRTTSKRFPVQKLWGPALPNEMVRPEAAAIFQSGVAAALPARLEHELSRILD